MHKCCQHCNPENERHKSTRFHGHMWPCFLCENEKALAAFRLKYLGAA
jgi:hypothetical protein